jgi:hypothetical protein
MTKIAGFGSDSGSGTIIQRRGSVDPDPHQNVMDPEHWYQCWKSFIFTQNFQKSFAVQAIFEPFVVHSKVIPQYNVYG